MSTKQPTVPAVRYKDLGLLGHPELRVGTDGSFWRFKGGEWVCRITKSRASKYINITLYPERRLYGIHQLVLLAFVGPCPPGMLCRHLNGDGHDNRLTNLKWGTYKENEEDKTRHGRRQIGENHPNAVLSDDDIPIIHRDYAAGCTIRSLAIRYGVTYMCIWRIIRGDSYGHVHSPTPIRGDKILGSDKACAKLTEADIPAIRTALRAGESIRSIAKRYGVGYALIHTIRHGRAWAHVPDVVA